MCVFKSDCTLPPKAKIDVFLKKIQEECSHKGVSGVHSEIKCTIRRKEALIISTVINIGLCGPIIIF